MLEVVETGEKLVVALDVDSVEKAVGLVEELRPLACMYKVGMELFYAAGSAIVEEIKSRRGRVFLDLKLHDIPNTVARAARVLTRLGADIMNVHAAGGMDMMRAAAGAVGEEASRLGIARPRLVAVTVLTSIDRDVFRNQIGFKGDIEDFVVRMALAAKECGLDGVVASPAEIGGIREACGPDFLVITPGIRPLWAEAGDQKRINTPAGAIAAGASYIVVGRPVTAATAPVEAAMRVVDEIKGCV